MMMMNDDDGEMGVYLSVREVRAVRVCAAFPPCAPTPRPACRVDRECKTKREKRRRVRV